MRRSTKTGNRRTILGVTSETIAVVVAAITILPVFWAIVTAFKSQSDVVRNPLGFPTVWRFVNFIGAWVQGHFGTYFVNSIVVVVPTVTGVIVLSLIAAYAFGTMKFPGKNLLFVLFLIGLSIPVWILVIPLFYDLLHMHMLNTLWSLVFPQLAGGLPFGILLLRAFIEDLPKETLDAGRIDGCRDWDLLSRIVAPLTGPAVMALLIFNFMWIWNSFLLPVVFIQVESARTLPVGLNFFQGQYSSNVPFLMAGSTITFVPVVVVYIIFQRQFIRGITAGAIK